MSTKRFTVLIVLTVLWRAAANAAIARWSRRLQQNVKMNQVSEPSDANVLLIGNSLLDGRIDSKAFTGVAPELIPLNAALGGSQPAEQYLLLLVGLKHPQIKQVVIGFYDFQLTSSPRTAVNDLVANRALAFNAKVHPADVAEAYELRPLARLQFRIYRALPMLSYRASGWERVELLRRKLGEIGMPEAANNSFGRVADFRFLESSSLDQFDRDAMNFVDHPENFNRPTELMLKRATAHNCPATIVLMPGSPAHRNLYYSRIVWAQYLQSLRALAERRGVRLIDASGWFPQEKDFADTLHMKIETAPAFSARLASALR